MLNDTRSPSFSKMWVHDHSNYAIRGSSVRGLTLEDSVLNGSLGNADDDGAVRLENVTGSASIRRTHIGGGFENNLWVLNNAGGTASGNLDRITLDNVNFGSNGITSGDDALKLHSTSGAGALKATIQNSQFTSARGDQIDYSHGGGGTGDLTLQGNTLDNNHSNQLADGSAVRAISEATAGGTVSVNASGNTLRRSKADNLLIRKTPNSQTMTASVSFNSIGDQGAGSGADANGIHLTNQGGGTLTAGVSNNTVRDYKNQAGIRVDANGTGGAQAGTVNATITGNTVEQPGVLAAIPGQPTPPTPTRHAVFVDNGSESGDSFGFCLDLKNNTLNNGGADSTPTPSGLGERDIRLNSRFNSSIRLPGYFGAATDMSAVSAFVLSNNSAGQPTTNMTNTSASGYTGGTPTTCPTP